MPADLWRRLINDTTERVDILAYAALYLAEEHALAKKLHKGAKKRLQSGNPDADPVMDRPEEESPASTFLGTRIRNQFCCRWRGND